ncbi:MAG TPA: hypothetical protein VK561_07285, partial [Bradyrhizobium sp.]|nr:hypothetical protein [Bradyrhizobium sp.]
MMAADYRHIGGLENRLGRHYSRFSPFLPTPALASQSLALQKLCDAGSNRRRRASPTHAEENAGAGELHLSNIELARIDAAFPRGPQQRT